jgi:hypothetical protein
MAPLPDGQWGFAMRLCPSKQPHRDMRSLRGRPSAGMANRRSPPYQAPSDLDGGPIRHGEGFDPNVIGGLKGGEGGSPPHRYTCVPRPPYECSNPPGEGILNSPMLRLATPTT